MIYSCKTSSIVDLSNKNIITLMVILCKGKIWICFISLNTFRFWVLLQIYFHFSFFKEHATVLAFLRLWSKHILSSNIFKWKHFESQIILLCVRWYLKYSLSYKNIEEMMAERGLSITQSTITIWVNHYSPIIDKRIRKYLRPTNDSWRVDETYIRIKGKWCYLYRAVDSKGYTIDFWVSENRDKKSAEKFFKKALGSSHNQIPKVITTDKSFV
jgi:hypothetical protein